MVGWRFEKLDFETGGRLLPREGLDFVPPRFGDISTASTLAYDSVLEMAWRVAGASVDADRGAASEAGEGGRRIRRGEAPVAAGKI